MKLIRLILGSIILFLDRITQPASPIRTAEEQKKVDQLTASFTLFQLHACPFCVKVRRQIKRLGLNIQTRDIGKDQSAYNELLAGGKVYQVPCLKIIHTNGRTEWLYESDAINLFLTQNS